MKKKLLSFDFLIVILTLTSSAYVMYARIKYHASRASAQERFLATRNNFYATREQPSKENIPADASELPTGKTSPTAFQPPSVQTKPVRNILFTIKTRAKKVSLTGDFNDWTSDEMAKDTRGIWSVAVKLPPGEYAYNFIVDGRPVRDFNNSRTKDTGRGFISSVIEVKPLE